MPLQQVNNSSPPKSSSETTLAYYYSKTEKQKYDDGAPTISPLAIASQTTPNNGRRRQQQRGGGGGSSFNRFFVVFGGFFLLFAISRTFVSMVRTEKEFTRIHNLYDQAADNMPRIRDDKKRIYWTNNDINQQKKNISIIAKGRDNIINSNNMNAAATSAPSSSKTEKGGIIGGQNPVKGLMTLPVDDDNNKSMEKIPANSNPSVSVSVTTTALQSVLNNEEEVIVKKVEDMIKKKNKNKKKKDSTQLQSVVFRWEYGGNSVNISGSFLDDWSYQIPMQRIIADDENDNNNSTDVVFICTYNLTRGQQHTYKFIVDDNEIIWKIAPDQPTITDEFGNVNNLIDLRDDKSADSTRDEKQQDSIIVNAGNSTHQPAIVFPNGTTTVVKYPHIREFERQEGVVIVTKLHGKHQLGLLRQSLCLLTKAYNHKMNYDIVAFTTMPINDTLLIPIREVVKPAKITVVIDNAGTLQKQVASLSEEKQTVFFNRCGVSNADNMTWWTMCDEKRVGRNRIAYAWQAEFRTLHIWKHPILAQYKYMMWLDTDGFSTRVWDRDPIAIAMQNDLAIFFANWPQGRARGQEAQDRIVRSFGEMLCRVKVKEGRLLGKMGKNCPKLEILVVHGFFHITNLDFYRSPKVQNFFQELIGDCFCCRRFDDQLAVTVPAAMLASDKSWDMYSHGIKLEVFHNFDLDGKRRRRVGGFIKYWKNNAQTKFPEAYGKCEITEGG